MMLTGNDDVVLGRADLFDRLDLVLPQLGSTSSSELVRYWFEHDAELDRRLLAELDEARVRGIAVHLVTVQEHHRARYLWETLRLCEHFDAMHYAAELGHRKSDPQFYDIVAARTGLAPAEHLLVDDTEANVDTAVAAGWQGIVWRPGRRVPLD